MNEPLTKGAHVEPWERAGGMRENTIVLSFSGGGLRAAAFSHGVLLALHEQATPRGELLDDVALISSVSGSSLTAAYFGLNGVDGLGRFRDEVLVPGFERDLRTSVNPVNLVRILGSNLNTSGDLAGALDRGVFRHATFADLHRRSTVDVRIHATELYHGMPFPFIPAAFAELCSDLYRYPVANAVAASMAVPAVFSPVVLRSYPGQCSPDANELPQKVQRSRAGAAISEAITSYREPPVKYARLVDGGLTDNFAVSDLMVMRLFMGTPYAPMTERDAVRVRRLLVITVDASRHLKGEWLEKHDGPEGIALALAAMDAAIDSASRLAVDSFVQNVEEWQRSVVEFRCSLTAEQANALGAPPGWNCRDVSFSVAHISVHDLPSPLRERVAAIPTRLALRPEEIDDAIEGGREATRALPELRSYLADEQRTTNRLAKGPQPK